jgi:hypothetical protein
MFGLIKFGKGTASGPLPAGTLGGVVGLALIWINAWKTRHSESAWNGRASQLPLDARPRRAETGIAVVISRRAELAKAGLQERPAYTAQKTKNHRRDVHEVRDLL